MAVLIVAAFFTISVSAQSTKEYQAYPYVFIGLQGGVQTQFTNYPAKNLITPMGQVSLGAYFNPVVGARITASGIWAKGRLNSVAESYKYKQATGNVDLLVNLSNLFTGRKQSVVNAVLLGGVGLNYAWDNDDLLALQQLPGCNDNLTVAWKDNCLCHNFRVGLQLGFTFCRNLDFNIEVGANSNADKYNSKYSGSDDWSGYALAGFAIKFGHKKVVPEPEPEPIVIEEAPKTAEVWTVKVDTIWYDETLYKDVKIEESITRNINYPISGIKNNVAAQNVVAEIAAFVKEYEDVKVDVKSYADKGTGSAAKNMKISEKRRKGTVEALVGAGIAEGIITSEAFGDTVQPFEKNKDNRVSIITATATITKKEPYTVRKFRTEEKRIRVE